MSPQYRDSATSVLGRGLLVQGPVGVLTGNASKAVSGSWISEDTFLQRDWTGVGIRFAFGEPAKTETVDGRTVHMWSHEHVQRREAQMAISMADAEAEALMSNPVELKLLSKDGIDPTLAQLTRSFVKREVDSSLTLKSVRQARALVADAE